MAKKDKMIVATNEWHLIFRFFQHKLNLTMLWYLDGLNNLHGRIGFIFYREGDRVCPVEGPAGQPQLLHFRQGGQAVPHPPLQHWPLLARVEDLTSSPENLGLSGPKTRLRVPGKRKTKLDKGEISRPCGFHHGGEVLKMFLMLFSYVTSISKNLLSVKN